MTVMLAILIFMKGKNDIYIHLQIDIVCIGVSIPPPLFLSKPPSLNLQTVQASTPFLGNPQLYTGFSGSPPQLKIRFFSDAAKY